MKIDKKKMIAIIVVLFFAAAAAYAGRQAYSIYAEDQAGEKSYANLEQYVSGPSGALKIPEASLEGQKIVFPEIDFESLREINSQVVGWIYCEDTVINYPIVQGEDNDYYVYHMFDGQYNAAGSIFLDYRNSSDFSDRHSIIYGHHLRNGNMFASLVDYKDQTYYEKRPRLLLITPQKNYIVEVFAGYVADVEDEAWDMDFDSDQAYLAWLGRSIEKSPFQAGIIPTADDKVLTLSTCTYEFADARFVLVGILREEP